jgi:7-cyano-7-deazaguanine synthase in queuosine biosynthesis
VPKDAILLISGGLDSFIQWRLLNYPKAIYFDIGNKARQSELRKVLSMRSYFDKPIEIRTNLRLTEFEMDNAYIPYRNMIFFLLAANISPNIILCQICEWAPDKNKRFYRHAEKLMREMGSGKFQGIDTSPKIYTPFAGFTKTELVREYVKRWPASDLIKYTTSCYNSAVMPCGRCTACVSREIALVNNGIFEPTMEPVNVDNFNKKLNIKDFHWQDLSMYIKRWKEIREYRRNLEEIT